MRVALVQLPTLELQLAGYVDNLITLGNVYNRIMPASLPRVAEILRRDIDVEVSIEDCRIADPERRETYKEISYGKYTIYANRVGGAFSTIDEKIQDVEWVGVSSHFTSDSQIVEDFITHAKGVNPQVKVMVGGADVRAQPKKYFEMGADLVFSTDLDPQEVANFSERKIVEPFTYPLEQLLFPAFDLLSHLHEYCDSHDGPTPDGVESPVGFITFTRGCQRECDFCESSRTGYDKLGLEDSVRMLEHYKKAGIRTLNFIDDNLLLQVGNKRYREKIIKVFRQMKEMGFAWEFPGGLEVGMLAPKGRIDEELVDALFYHERDESGKITGGYRLYFPIETLDPEERKNYRKLKTVSTQDKIIHALAKRKIPQIAFGVIIFPDATQETARSMGQGYGRIRKIVEQVSSGATQARYGVLNFIPIATHRSMEGILYTDPELRHFYTPCYIGQHLSAQELFELRMNITKKVDPANFNSMLKGKYGYG